MALIYITGSPGVGKTVIAHELKRQGVEAYSADEEDFNGWYDRKTGRKHITKEGEDHHTPEWDANFEWKTDEPMVRALQTRAKNKDIYLTGVASNQKELFKIVDIIVYLHVDEATLRHRLATRTNNPYGKAPHELKGVLKYHKSGVDDHLSFGAINYRSF